MLKLVLLVLISLPGVAESQARPPADGLRVTFVGNAGFLVTVGDKKILIDALFTGFPGEYTLPAEIQTKLTLGQPPFDGIDLALATHTHADHFAAGLVRSFLQHNPAAVFASTPQAAAALGDGGDRVVIFTPTRNHPDSKQIKGISIKAIYLPHGPPAAGRTEILNFGYLIKINGQTLFHSGDIDTDQFSFEEFRALRLPEAKIDVAFLQHFYFTALPAERHLIQDGIAARYLIPAHYHFTVPPMDAQAIRRYYPAAILFSAELQSWVAGPSQAEK
jgi:L-ascorbate metabolism protein UlaG (beta-lactamase superfamily)